MEIEPQPQDIAAVFIVGRKADKALQAHTQEHKMKMAPEALKLLPNLGEKDILRGFQLMSGVSASNESSSGMYVRGGTPDQNLILYDGFTIYYVDHMHGFYSAFNSNAIKDVQLYNGGYEAKYGGRLSSVTEITAKDGNRNKFTVGGEVSLLSMNAYAEIPVSEKLIAMLAFRRSYQGYLWEHISGQNTVSSDRLLSRDLLRWVRCPRIPRISMTLTQRSRTHRPGTMLSHSASSTARTITTTRLSSDLTEAALSSVTLMCPLRGYIRREGHIPHRSVAIRFRRQAVRWSPVMPSVTSGRQDLQHLSDYGG